MTGYAQQVTAQIAAITTCLNRPSVDRTDHDRQALDDQAEARRDRHVSEDLTTRRTDR